MQIKSRLSILLMLVAISALCASTAWARGAGPQHPRGPGQENPHDVKSMETPSPSRSEIGERTEVDLENRNQVRRRAHQPCRNRARRGVPGGCYLSGDDWVEDVETSEPGAPPAARQEDSATLPVTRTPSTPSDESTHLNVIAPASDEAMRNELIAARKNWLEKKQISEDAAAARARADYRATKDGSTVDPELIERQRVADDQEIKAHQAMGPLVERARAAGFSSETLELYEKASRGY